MTCLNKIKGWRKEKSSGDLGEDPTPLLQDLLVSNPPPENKVPIVVKKMAGQSARSGRRVGGLDFGITTDARIFTPA